MRRRSQSGIGCCLLGGQATHSPGRFSCILGRCSEQSRLLVDCCHQNQLSLGSPRRLQVFAWRQSAPSVLSGDALAYAHALCFNKAVASILSLSLSLSISFSLYLFLSLFLSSSLSIFLSLSTPVFPSATQDQHERRGGRRPLRIVDSKQEPRQRSPQGKAASKTDPLRACRHSTHFSNRLWTRCGQNRGKSTAFKARQP